MAAISLLTDICQEVLAKQEINGFRNEVCGRVNRSLPPGTKLPSKLGLRGSAGSSIVLEACEFSGGTGHLHGAEVYLVEIPSQLIIRDSWMQAEVNGGVHGVIKNGAFPSPLLPFSPQPTPDRFPHQDSERSAEFRQL